jgi:hypothetical protein
MNFITIKSNIIDIYAAAALAAPVDEKFSVAQAQKQKEGAKALNDLKQLTVYFAENTFPEESSSANSEKQSKPLYHIELKVSAKGKVADLSDPKTISSAEIEADNMLDLFFAQSYQIIMDAENLDLGMEKGQISNRFIKKMIKGSPNQQGEYVVLVGRMDLSLNTAEDVSGEAGDPGTINESDIEINEDSTQQTGITIDTTP